MSENVNVNVLLGKTLISVKQVGMDGDELHFTTLDGDTFRMYHGQDCCESVSIEDICGDLTDLVGSPIVQAEESTNSDDNSKNDDSFLWTFYRLATAKGQVVIRWYGTSNGYYSESVDFERITGSSL